MTLEVRTEVMEEDEGAVEDCGWNDDICVDGDERNGETFGERCAPAFGLAERILVADEDCGLDFIEELFERVFGRAADDEANTEFGCISSAIAKALLHEVEVTRVCAGKIPHDAEVDYDWKVEFIGDVDCNVECGIFVDALRALHPVDDAFGVVARCGVATDENARILGERCDGHACFYCQVSVCVSAELRASRFN